jgi:glycosyltransferase involved in cell wall biosynthesis
LSFPRWLTAEEPAGAATVVSPLRHLTECSVAIVANGFADGNAQALRDYLVGRGAGSVTTISHPLVREDGGRHEIRRWNRGQLVSSRTVRLPSLPPATYPLDLLAPLLPPRVDAWMGFNALACWQGLAARAAGRVGVVAYWCVDYVDNRFGRNPLTWLFDRVDRFCCRHANARFEVSEAALAARTERHSGDTRQLAPARVVPMGAWLDRVRTTDLENFHHRRVVYLGHLVPRQGVHLLVDALALLRRRGLVINADVVGRGPLERELRARAAGCGVGDTVTFHGFVPDHQDVERILAGGSVAIAPYDTDVDSFTRFADPGKLKAYLAAGLPILLTEVPPNSRSLAEAGVAEIVPFRAEAFADALERLLADEEDWRRRREAALEQGRRYDWSRIFPPALRSLGLEA